MIVDRREFDRRARGGSPRPPRQSSSRAPSRVRDRPPTRRHGRSVPSLATIASASCPRRRLAGAGARPACVVRRAICILQRDEGDRSRRRRRARQSRSGGGGLRDLLARGRGARRARRTARHGHEQRGRVPGAAARPGARARAGRHRGRGGRRLRADRQAGHGLYKVKHEAMRPLHREALAALQRVRALDRSARCPARRTRDADALVNAALDQARDGRHGCKQSLRAGAGSVQRLGR